MSIAGLNLDLGSDKVSGASASLKPTSTPGLSGAPAGITFGTPQSRYQITPVSSGEVQGPPGPPGQSVEDIVKQIMGSTPQPAIPRLDYTPPTSAALDAKWKEFLQRASQDPDLVNYYQNKLNLAQGNAQIAVQYLEQDYATGVRQTEENKQANLEANKITSTKESDKLLNDLNQRGIALTQGPTPGTTPYAGGGQPATEVGQLGQTQKLRDEAEQRSASQKIENLGLTRDKGEVTAGQTLKGQQMDLQKSKETDISSRAQQYMGLYQGGEQNKLLQAQIDQQNKMSGGGGGGDTELQQLEKTDRNPIQERRYQQLKAGG